MLIKTLMAAAGAVCLFTSAASAAIVEIDFAGPEFTATALPVTNEYAASGLTFSGMSFFGDDIDGQDIDPIDDASVFNGFLNLDNEEFTPAVGRIDFATPVFRVVAEVFAFVASVPIGLAAFDANDTQVDVGTFEPANIGDSGLITVEGLGIAYVLFTGIDGTTPGGLTTLTFESAEAVIPLPGAAVLFLGALGAGGFLRRKAA